MRLSDLGEVVNSVQDLRNAGLYDGKPSVLVIIHKQPGANVIETWTRIGLSACGTERHQRFHGLGPDHHHPHLDPGSRPHPDDFGDPG